MIQKHFSESAALIAGGRARRMGGAPKGLITLDGQPILRRLLALLAPLPTRIIGDPGGPYAGHGVPVLPDLLPGHGPPGGVHTALATAPPGWVFIASIDLPALDAASITALATRRDQQHAVLAIADDHVQPLAGWWHTRAAPLLEAGLLAGDRGFRPLLARLDVLTLPLPPAPFRGLNTPEDVAAIGATLPSAQ
ncbi:MAG: molybdenum cofactor guanylyltransferase [bacterium]